MTTFHIVFSRFDPLQEKHIGNIKASYESSDGVIVSSNSDKLVFSKGNSRTAGNMPKIRKVAFFLPHVIMGGVEKVLLEILTEIRKQRPQWGIVIYSRRPVKDRYFTNFFKKHGIKLKDHWTLIKPKKFLPKLAYKLVNPFYKKLSLPIAKTIIALGKYDVLVDFQSFNFAKEIHKLAIPKITWLHGGINYFNRNSDEALKYIGDYDKVVCLSDSFKEDFSEQYPDYKDKIVRIHNSVNAKEIQGKAKADKSHGKYFVIVSRFDGEKDNETIISAFKILAKKQPDAKLYIAGEGNLEKKMKSMAADCPQIEFLGKIYEPYTLIKNSIGHILSSYSEGLPMVLLENAALGTLSISSRCKSGPPEILLDGKAGILFNPGDHKELAKILSDVWNGKIDTAKLIKTATDNLDRFSSEHNTKQIINLIEEVYDEKSV
ncbi:MAG: glycosyltransferase [Puniceicoccales bacterium]|nr:glycosyltransferase [Puniceicoccales bacterium]